MKATSSADLSHASSCQYGHPVGSSKNPVGMSDLQRRLAAGKAGILELDLLRESHRRFVEEAKNLLENHLQRMTDKVECMPDRRSQRSVSESCDGAPEFSSSDEEETDSSSVDDVFYATPGTSIIIPRNISSCSNTGLLSTVPSRLPSASSSNIAKLRRMSEFRHRGVAPNGKPSLCRTFNGVWSTPHRCQSDGAACLRSPLRSSQGLCLTDSYRKPVILSELTFEFPSPLHAVLSQFDFKRARFPVDPATGRSVTHHPSEGRTEGSSTCALRHGKSMGDLQVDLVGRCKWGPRESARSALQSHLTGLRLTEAESSLLHPQRTRGRLGETALFQPQSRRLFSRTLEKEGLGETLTSVPCFSSKVDECSSEDSSKIQNSVLELCSSVDKEKQEQCRGFDPSKRAAFRPYLGRTALYNLSEEGYFSGSDSHPGTLQKQPPRRRRKGGSQTCASRTSTTAKSAEDREEPKPKPKQEGNETETETETRSPPERLPVFC